MPSCIFCAAEGVWLRDLDPHASQFTLYGQGNVFGSPISLCDRCERLWQADDEVALIALFAEAHADDRDMATEAAMLVGVLRRAGQGPAVRYEETLPPGVTELRAHRFVPVEEITGWDGVAMVWPEEHRRGVPETREHMEGDTCWLVRPPSTSLDAVDYLSAIHAVEQREAAADQRTALDEYEARLSRAAQQVFGMAPEDVKMLADTDPGTDTSG